MHIYVVHNETCVCIYAHTSLGEIHISDLIHFKIEIRDRADPGGERKKKIDDDARKINAIVFQLTW